MYGFPQQFPQFSGLDSGFPFDSAQQIFPSQILPTSYVSGLGTPGTDATAQIVKSIILPANTLRSINQGIRIRATWINSSGSVLAVTLQLNGITIGANSQNNVATQMMIVDLMYVDPTHSNYMGFTSFGSTANAALSTGGSINASGFAHQSNQVISVNQNSVAATHATVYEIRVENLLKN